MTEKKLSLGQAIDAIIQALEPLESSVRNTAIQAACSHLQIQIERQEEQPSVSKMQIASTHSSHLGLKQVDIRSLKEEKSPKSAAQMACVVAYFLQELAPLNERKNTVNATDLTKYFKQANFKLPKTISQVLIDGKIAGYFDSIAKGEYSLNAVGYNLVAHNLPKNSDK